MGKIKLFEQRNLGNTVNSTIKLMRQNFRLISLSFLVFVMPLLIISVLFITFSISLGGPDTKTQIAINMPIFQIGFIIYMITLFVEAIVLHEVIIAYEHNDDLQNINLTDVWAFINGDFRRIIGSFLGIIPLAICFGIIAIIINTAIISISHSIGGLSILLICLTFIYIYVSMTNYLMLRLRSEYTVITSLSKCLSLTSGGWRWWRTLGVHAIMLLIIGGFLFATLFAFIFVENIYRGFFASPLSENNAIRFGYNFFIFLSVYSIIMFTYLSNLVLLGSTINYYSLIEETEHVSIQVEIEKIGNRDSSPIINEGEY